MKRISGSGSPESSSSGVNVHVYSPLGKQPLGNVHTISVAFAPALEAWRANKLRLGQPQSGDFRFKFSWQHVGWPVPEPVGVAACSLPRRQIESFHGPRSYSSAGN